MDYFHIKDNPEKVRELVQRYHAKGKKEKTAFFHNYIAVMYPDRIKYIEREFSYLVPELNAKYYAKSDKLFEMNPPVWHENGLEVMLNELFII